MKDPKKVSELIELHLELKGALLPSDESKGELIDDFDDITLPPRREIFPAQKPKLTRIFYNTLFILFFILIIGLTFWGVKMNE